MKDEIDPRNEIEFLGHHESCGQQLSVRLITYPDGSRYLHSQTGFGHLDAVERAVTLLKGRGLQVSQPVFMGPTGIYYKVEPSGNLRPEKIWTKEVKGRWVKI